LPGLREMKQRTERNSTHYGYFIAKDSEAKKYSSINRAVASSTVLQHRPIVTGYFTDNYVFPFLG
jgi:hypothetical protein